MDLFFFILELVLSEKIFKNFKITTFMAICLFITCSVANASEVINYKIKRGDSLSSILYSMGIAKSGRLAKEIDGITKKQIRKYVQTGRYLYIKSNGPFLEKLIFKISALKSYEIVIDNSNLAANKINAKEIIKDTYKKIAYFDGVITKENNSIYKVGKSNKHKIITDDIIDQMAEILGWKIDFETEVRLGDRFKLVYEEIYHEDKKIYGGDILAIQYIHYNKRQKKIRKLQAVRFHYNDKPTYFDLSGESVQKTFLRYPLKFSRISSKFRSRYHPIFKKWKAHSGVDFAAAHGTPVYSVGDGKVTIKKYNRGYGRYVAIEHRNGVTTKYAHLKGFAKGLRVGKYVSKKQIIGYVGSSGYATGPHLHYEFIKNGRKVNPLKVRIPSAHPVAKKNMDEFKCLANYWKEIFDSHFLVDPVIVSRKPRQCNINRLSSGDKKKVIRNL